MKIYPVNERQISFKRHLTAAEERQMRELSTQAKEILGNTGNSVLVVHDACLPQSVELNTGVANILNGKSAKFFDFAKTYWGVNTIEVLPQGEFLRKHRRGLVCAYGYSALGLNESLIDLETLTRRGWRNIVLPEELEAVVNANNSADKAVRVNYENIYEPDSVFSKTMRLAFERFLKLNEADSLRKDFERYKKDNSDWLEPKAVYNVLKRENGGREFSRWGSELDRCLYIDNNELFSDAQRKSRIADIVRDNSEEMEFYKFKQFVAEKHLQAGREVLHDKGMKLFGDMAIKFSPDEIWANPEAFWHNCYIGANDWKAPCLNYDALLDENSAAAMLLKRKAGLNARRYDGIRFDASWMYVAPRVFNLETKKTSNPSLGEHVLVMMENEIKRVQGEAFDKENLIHEFKAGADDFIAINGGIPRSEIRNRVSILDSEHLSDGWGHRKYFSETVGLHADEFIMGIGDHTSQPLMQIVRSYSDPVTNLPAGARLKGQAAVLSQLFGQSFEDMLKPTEFINAKFADIMGAKHNFIFYMDALGRVDRFDSQKYNGEENYRYKISADYLDKYHAELQKGHALNLPDVLAKAFEREHLDETHCDIYEQLCKFAKILREKDGTQSVLDLTKKTSGLGWKGTALIGVSVIALCALGISVFEKIKQNKKQN